MTTLMYKKYLNKLFLLAGIVGLISSCISPKETNLLQPDEKPYYSVKPYEDYKIQVYDEIYCTILTDNTDFMEEYQQAYSSIITTTSGGGSQQTSYIVSSSGYISIPLFGSIKVEGLTVSEAETAIQKEMKKSYPDAEVRVRLRNNSFYVVSGGKNGMYPIYKDNMTIYQALAISGNISDEIDLSKIKIIRLNEDGASSTVKTFNLRTESVIESEFYYIKPNDLIYYTTSGSSFFKVRSFTALFATILTPVTFLITMLAFDFK
ncbi:polysaccharide biosynthesis/export family protein [Viscerimonas tarda]